MDVWISSSGSPKDVSRSGAARGCFTFIKLMMAHLWHQVKTLFQAGMGQSQSDSLVTGFENKQLIFMWVQQCMNGGKRF